MLFPFTQELVPLVIAPAGIAWLIVVILHVAIALRICANARMIETGRIAPYLAPWIWGLSALLGGIVLAGLFWLIYYSTLQRLEVTEKEPAPFRISFAVPQAVWVALTISGAIFFVGVYLMALLSERP